jgi:hypothetical protein
MSDLMDYGWIGVPVSLETAWDWQTGPEWVLRHYAEEYAVEFGVQILPGPPWLVPSARHPGFELRYPAWRYA